MRGRSFIKMHGLGNDFVVLDARTHPLALEPKGVRAIADRHTGVGCDQVIVMTPSDAADLAMRIFNADGGEVGACGNAARCVAALVMAEDGREGVTIETASGMLKASGAGEDRVSVDMGAPRTDWREIPLTEPRDTLHLDIGAGMLEDPVAVSMGNPHAVFFVPHAAAIELCEVGPLLEVHPLFPERANIGVAEVESADRIRLRVWERGAGITLACGTGACAALVAAHRRGLTGRRAEVALDGGTLAIEWREGDGHVLMTGPVATSFRGALDPGLLA